MALQAKAGFTGLMTNIAETMSPAGALLEAENVVIRKAGAVESRDGVNKVGAVSGGVAAWGFSWRSKDFYLRNNGSNVFAWRDTSGGTYQYTDPVLGTLDPQPFRRDSFARAEARASLYLPYDSGTLKMDTDAGPWRQAGLHIQTAFASAVMSVSGSWLPNNERVAYRLVCVKKDANSMLISSVPSGFVIAENTSGGARAVQLSIQAVPGGGPGFDYFEIYRSANVPTTVSVSDEMQLVATIPYGLGGTWNVLDNVAPSARGRAMYTSPSRGGSAQQNNRPPAAAATATYRGSVFWGNVRGPRRITISANVSSAALTGSATGVGLRVYTGDISSGSADIINLSSTVGLQKGMIVNHANVPVGAYITNISGTTVTISVQATGNAVGASINWRDAVRLGTKWVPINGGLDVFLNAYATAHQFQVYGVTPPESGYLHTYVIETITRSSAAMSIQATHGDEYNPPLPEYDDASLDMDQDAWPGGIIWSKTDEPEHVRPGDYRFVGDQRKAVLGLVTTRDALFILKEDGVFRLTGANGVWRVDPFEPNCLCVLPMSVQSINGLAYFLSAEGVAALDDGGISIISKPINDQVKLTIDQIMANWRSTGFYEVNGSQGASYSAVFDRENEYTLMRSSTDNHLVYNADTRAWTTWKYYAHASESYVNRSVFAFARTGRVIYAMGADYYETILSTAVSANYERYDRITSITVNSYGAGVATLAAPITALEDDIIEDSNDRFWRITADVVASASVPVQLGGGTASMGTGAGFLYRSQRCKVVATGYTEPGASQKSWLSFMTAWQRFQGAVVLKYGYQSSESPTWAEEDAVSSVSSTPAGATGNGYTEYALGFHALGKVPVNSHARAWLLRARVRWALSFGQAQLEAMGAEFTPLAPGSQSQVAA